MAAALDRDQPAPRPSPCHGLGSFRQEDVGLRSPQTQHLAIERIPLRPLIGVVRMQFEVKHYLRIVVRCDPAIRQATRGGFRQAMPLRIVVR